MNIISTQFFFIEQSFILLTTWIHQKKSRYLKYLVTLKSRLSRFTWKPDFTLLTETKQWQNITLWSLSKDVPVLQILSLCLNVCTVSVTMLQCVCNCTHGDQRSCPKQSLINILPSIKIQHSSTGLPAPVQLADRETNTEWGEAIQRLHCWCLDQPSLILNLT